MKWAAAATIVATALMLASPSGAATRASFSGSCQFSGPITPMPPITAVPKPGAHFSYRGSGTCAGGAPITVTFTDVATLFDTCELGPDFNLHGSATIGRLRLAITINLARLALAGPFWLTAAGGGQAIGLAQFGASSPQQCVSPGIASATLSATFRTLSPLVGTLEPPAPAASPKHRSHRRHRRCHAHAKCSRRGR